MKKDLNSWRFHLDRFVRQAKREGATRIVIQVDYPDVNVRTRWTPAMDSKRAKKARD